MSVYVPRYYSKFKCIAGDCKHNCCIGWEIDIDEHTLSKYRRLEGGIGEWIRNSIYNCGDAYCFKLDKNERCSMLNENGLCDIITELGESALCEICSEHPRFRNDFTYFTEKGIGICCEQAAKIVLTDAVVFSLIGTDGDSQPQLTPYEKIFFDLRKNVFLILCDRTKSIRKRFELLADDYDFSFSEFTLDKVIPLFLSLERLDEQWTYILRDSVDDLSLLDNETFAIPFEQLACYFIYRHFLTAVFDGDSLSRVRFCLASCTVIAFICAGHVHKNGRISVEDLTEYARLFSCEVEYSEQNIQALFENI